VRAPLTLVALVVLGLSSLGWAGCAGGQSGTECNTGDSNRDVNPFNTEATDEDGGVDDGGDAEISFVGDDGPEAQSDPIQCLPGAED
jgi:hypothetical protein